MNEYKRTSEMGSTVYQRPSVGTVVTGPSWSSVPDIYCGPAKRPDSGPGRSPIGSPRRFSARIEFPKPADLAIAWISTAFVLGFFLGIFFLM